MCISERFTQRFPEQLNSSKVIRRRNWATKEWVVAGLACVLVLLGVGLAETATASANVPTFGHKAKSFRLRTMPSIPGLQIPSQSATNRQS
jgi:hypothetical protein